MNEGVRHEPMPFTASADHEGLEKQGQEHATILPGANGYQRGHDDDQERDAEPHGAAKLVAGQAFNGCGP
ncbi:MAG: hypothetical protein KDC02_13175 [Flavobacteriales bacterium]|nr:hypothetical protein [Flavobacteriales bacterium]